MARAYKAAMLPEQPTNGYGDFDTPFNRMVYAVWSLRQTLTFQLRNDASMQSAEMYMAWGFELAGFRQLHPDCDDGESGNLEMLTYFAWKYVVNREYSRLFVLDL